MAEAGVVTFEWTLESPKSGLQRGEATLTFDRWGHRQSTSGYPGPNANKTIVVDQAKLTTYLPALRTAISTPWNAAQVFTVDELRTLQEALPESRQSRGASKVLAGIPCVVAVTEKKLPGGTSTTHAECIGKGIPLEVAESVAGGVMDGFKVHLVATKVDFHAVVPESLFSIPEDIRIIDTAEELANPDQRQRVLEAARALDAGKASRTDADAGSASR